MNKTLTPALIAAAACLLSFPAFAASSPWAQVEGGAVRLVTDGLPGSDGMLRGALQIRLKPGWKTYWRDPGEAGIPPTVTVVEPANATNVEIGFPAPKRVDDGYSVWAGYDQPVALALAFDLPDAGARNLGVSVFLGICEMICIPVQADFSIDLSDNSQAMPDREIVERAFAAVPRQAGRGFEATLVETGESRLLIGVEVPAAAPATDLFVASTENWAFAAPRRTEDGESAAYEVPVLAAPQDPVRETIHYTLVSGDDAVSGTFEIRR